MKYHLDPAAWVPPGMINAIKNCAHCNWGLTTREGEVIVPFIALLSLFDRTQGRVRGINAGHWPEKYHLDPAAWVLSGNINALKNCAHCNWGLTTLLGEVKVRFIPLLSLFDRTQGHVCGGKAGQLA